VNLKELSLEGNKQINEVSFITSLKGLTKLNLDGCPNIRDIETLTQVSSLKELKFDSNPSMAIYVLITASLNRNDPDWFFEKHKEIVETLETMPFLEPFASTYLDALNLFCFTNGNPLSSTEKLTSITDKLFSRDDLREDTLQKYFTVFRRIMGFEGFRSMLGHLSERFPGKEEIIIRPLVVVLSDAKEEPERAWAREYVTEKLKPFFNDREKVEPLAPTVCLFYAKMNMPELVKQWMRRATEAVTPVWRDTILTALVKWRSSRGEMQEAKKLIEDIYLPANRNTALENYNDNLSVKEDTRALYDEIMQHIQVLCNDIDPFPVVINDHNGGGIFSLLQPLEKYPEKLSQLIHIITDKYPGSEVVSIVAAMYAEKQKSVGVIEMAELFLQKEEIIAITKPRKREELIKKIKKNPELLYAKLNEELLRLLISKGLIDNEEAEIIRKEHHQQIGEANK